jgi:phage/plasmid-like protein (TIGR03299 family)
MAHELTATDYMVSASNKTPWHGLGAILPGNLTATQALEAARLNWTVEQEPVFDSDMKNIVTHQFNRRSDTREILGVVSKGWQPVQNDRLLEIAEALAQVDNVDFRPVIETAGSLKGGRVVWALVKTGERVFADSQHKTYLLLSNGHDGLRAVRGTLTDTRVVCANTLRLAESGLSSLYVSHARGVETRMRSAIDALGWANDATRATFSIYEALAAAPVNVDAATATFRKLILGSSPANPIPKRHAEAIDEMTDLFRKGPGNSGSNAFDVLNAVTDWVDHHKNFRDDEGKAERRFLYSSLGEGSNLKVSALRAAKQLAGV